MKSCSNLRLQGSFRNRVERVLRLFSLSVRLYVRNSSRTSERIPMAFYIEDSYRNLSEHCGQCLTNITATVYYSWIPFHCVIELIIYCKTVHHNVSRYPYIKSTCFDCRQSSSGRGALLLTIRSSAYL
jgi:hypothetical protein